MRGYLGNQQSTIVVIVNVENFYHRFGWLSCVQLDGCNSTARCNGVLWALLLNRGGCRAVGVTWATTKHHCEPFGAVVAGGRSVQFGVWVFLHS